MKTTSLILDVVQIIGGIILIIASVYSFIRFFVNLNKRELVITNDLITNLNILEKQIELLEERTKHSSEKHELKLLHLKETIRGIKEDILHMQNYLNTFDGFSIMKKKQ